MSRTAERPSRVYLSPGQVEQKTQIKARTLREWRMKGKGPPYSQPAGKVVRYPEDELEQWLEQFMTRPVNNDPSAIPLRNLRQIVRRPQGESEQ